MIANRVKARLASGSMIRKMFEEGNRLKALYGPDNVFDFSIGNPDLEPPKEIIDAIIQQALDQTPGQHSYMSNNGYLQTREAVAAKLTADSGLKVSANDICMTVGAAGALNACLRALLDPEDEVIILAPFFMEYLAYIDNFLGVSTVVPTLPDSFQLDFSAITKAITPKTKAIIINSPNNPSGAIYPAEDLIKLNQLLLQQDHVIHVISDEPYNELVYDGMTTPVSLKYIKNLLVCYSWSKSISLPGERIGYVAVSPQHEDHDELCPALVMCNRILGSVNAPAFFQKVIAKHLYAKADIANYEYRRNLLYSIITEAGFSCRKPAGALYLFPKAPIEDQEFSRICAEKFKLLLVPGSAFHCPGYFRLPFCVSEHTIVNSKSTFMAIGKEFGLIS